MTGDWRDQAACLHAVERGEANHDDWWPETSVVANLTPENRAAITLCQTCPVQTGCLDHAMRQEQGKGQSRYGVWGGLMPHHRYRRAANTRRRETRAVTR